MSVYLNNAHRTDKQNEDIVFYGCQANVKTKEFYIYWTYARLDLEEQLHTFIDHSAARHELFCISQNPEKRLFSGRFVTLRIEGLAKKS